MSNPITIMNDIESRHWSDVTEEEWQELRKAVEAQADDLSICEKAFRDEQADATRLRAKLARLELVELVKKNKKISELKDELRVKQMVLDEVEDMLEEKIIEAVIEAAKRGD